MKISVIIPVYNKLKYLETAFLSILNQSRVPEEIIISDDGSEEDVKSILNSFSLKNTDVKYVRQEHKGFRAGKCRNNGVRISSGDLLIFWDQDIVVTHHYIELFEKNISRKNFITSCRIALGENQSALIKREEIISGNFTNLLNPEQFAFLKKKYFKDVFYRFYSSYINKKKTRPKFYSGISGVLKENFMLVNGFDEMYRGWGHEDDDFGNRLYASGIIGKNPFKYDYAVHIYHPTLSSKTIRPNDEYYYKQKKEIFRGKNIYCKYGINNPFEE